ncbi:MAG: hypothetical protein QHH13_14450 [Melioribacter sp.]|nr:hypothetical protein [Melioribacter sp.]
MTILTIVISKIVNKKEPGEKPAAQEIKNTYKKESLNQIPDYKIDLAQGQNINNYSLPNSKQNLQQNKKIIKAEIKYNINAERNNKNKRIEILNNNSKSSMNHEKIQTPKYNHEKSRKDFKDKNNHDILSKYSEDDKYLYSPDTKKKNNNKK